MDVQYLIDTEAESVVNGRKNFNGPSALQRYHQEAVKCFIIVNATTVAEPTSPVNGQMYLIPPAPAGPVTGAAWAAAPLNLTNNDLVARSENAWAKITPFNGLELFDLALGLRYQRVGGAWLPTAIAKQQFDGVIAGATIDIPKTTPQGFINVTIGGGWRLPQAAFTAAVNTPTPGVTRITLTGYSADMDGQAYVIDA